MSGKLFSRLAGSGFIRFALVGVVNTLIGLTVTFVCLNAFELNYWLSTLLGNVVGAVNSFLMNKSFTFRSKAKVKDTLWKFMAITAICYGVAYGLASVAVEQLLGMILPITSQRVQDNVAALVGSGIYTVLNYFGQKLVTFRDKTEPTREESRQI